MALEITGKIQQIMPQQTGVSKNGAWSKRDFIIETMEQYPRKVCISVWGDKSDTLEKQHPVGSVITAGINIESREYNGKWYTDVRAWKIDTASQETQHPPEIPPSIADDETGTFTDNELGEIIPF
ncbi:MAG: DUF3127 domain-containing protein [Bacteroidales bacterium]|jgi:hypothetical protein|nr:DUF3127 domain-containing protein [Bacteroidales bacterium]